MEIERLIVNKLLESQEQTLSSYKGCTIKMTYDNLVRVYNRGGAMIGEFENTEEAYTYIDELPLKVKSPINNYKAPVYYLYRKGTLDRRNARAMYFFKDQNMCKWCCERDAQTYTKKVRDAILRRSKNLDSYSV